jgi:hypothetical protein
MTKYIDSDRSGALRAVFLGALLALPAAASATSPLQAIIDQMPANSWARINENRFDDVWTPADQRQLPGTPFFVIKSWTGGAWDPNHGYAYVWGGDGPAYAGNEVYRFNTNNLLWERASLPSAYMRNENDTPSGLPLYRTVDGPHHSPMSSETFDGVAYLPTVDRLAIMGGSVWPGDGRDYVDIDPTRRTGPYFWDPARADANKVGGLTGSHVNPQLFPDVLGGEMWENRDSRAVNGFDDSPRSTLYAKTAATVIDGKDVVYMAVIGTDGRLFKYTVNDLAQPELDTWEVVGTRIGGANYFGAGAAALDTTRNLFVHTANNLLIYWDLNNESPTNPSVRAQFDVVGDTPFQLSKVYGLDYSPVLDAFLLWAGNADLWMLTAPEQLGPTGWTLRQLTPSGPAPEIGPNTSVGVYGKWNFMPGYGTFIGTIDARAGDVWLYKPVPLPPALPLLAGAIGFLLVQRRGAKSRG